ncbi:MAG: DUF1592 domain-containing protein [Pirellulaceae bacterium]
MSTILLLGKMTIQAMNPRQRTTSSRFGFRQIGIRVMRVGCLAWIGVLWGPALALHGQEATDEVFGQQIHPLLEKYCFDCHSEEGAEADLRLEKYESVRLIREERPIWLKVLSQVQATSMPPADADQPTVDERSTLVAWIDRTINTVDCSGPVSPGRVTLRRLNRHEYRNTIRDLLGIDYQPASDFPADDVGYGFDNIGDVLSLPPLLMEKYLAAAEEISGSAVVVPDAPPALHVKISGDDLQGNGSSSGSSLRAMSTSGEAVTDVEFPVPGLYALRVLAAGDQAGPEPVRMSVRLDGREIRVHDVKAVPDRPQDHTTLVAAKAGRHAVGVAFLNDYYRPAAENQAGEDRNMYVAQVEVEGPIGTGSAEMPHAHQRIFVVVPGETVGYEEAAAAILARLATAAFRRPATAQEVERLVSLVGLAQHQGDSFEAGIQLALQAILVSPHFLFRVELDPEGDAEARALNDYELATRLSYFLWSSMPDETLFSLAHDGQLRESDHLEQQARRMLADPKSQAFIENFAGQWLQLRSLDDLTFDAQKFPGSNRELLSAMREETTRFFAAIVREDLSVLRILDADFTFLNEPLARHYGIEGVEGNAFRRVSLQDTPRRGILTQASVLAVTSNPTRTSPVKRGKFVLENLLGAPPPPPPPNVPELDDARRQLTGTLRQRLEQHRADPSCAACHRLMDPIGFAMERFDAVGRYRADDEGQPIDTSGVLPSGEEFAGLDDLRALLLQTQRREFSKCLVEKTLIYALGRGLEYYDQCAVHKIQEALEQDDYRFSRLVLEIVKSEPFQKQARKRSPE